MGGAPILGTGVTGRIGRHLVDRRTATDATVRAMTRRPANATEVAHVGADVVEGDFADKTSLEGALTTIDRFNRFDKNRRRE